jgi:2,4-dienoyl-CoA reductase-like NADH-dependent reductase (Old Yellow Enzyme family)/thioredoxin reductase
VKALTDNTYTKLFEPIKLGGRQFRNRIFAAPTGFQDLDEDGIVSPDAALYYGRKAMGGAASVTVGECNVDGRYGGGAKYFVRLDNPHSLHGLSRITRAVGDAGAVCSAELMHSGMYSNRWMDPPGECYGPVECEDDGRHVQAMSEEFIRYTIGKYANAAAFAKQCGFTMVTIHAGHGWLLSQFLNPNLNKRKDMWGGDSIENRARMVVAICDAIKERVGRSFPVEIRISGSECYAGGYDISEGIKIAKALDGHVDLIHVSAGSHEVEEVFTVTHPSLFLEDGCNVKYAAEIKKHVSTPVATVGALADPDLMESILRDGSADVVEIARGLLADPDIPLKAKACDGDNIRGCLRCLACFSELMNTGRFYCAINPEIGHEEDAIYAPAPISPRKTLVVGGGIAGMEAAVRMARRGHTVTLCEKSDKLGGVLLCEENVSFKKKLSAYIEHQRQALDAAWVTVHTGKEITPQEAAAGGYDIIITALGARPLVPKIPGIDGAGVVTAEDAYYDPQSAGSSPVILGAGLVGIELAIHLAMLGKKPTVIEMADKISDGGNFLHVKALNVEIAKYGIDVRFGMKAVRIEEGGVACESCASGAEEFFGGDKVIVAAGQKPLDEEAAAFTNCAPEVYAIGDCVVPKSIMSATSMAYATAKMAGRPLLR